MTKSRYVDQLTKSTKCVSKSSRRNVSDEPFRKRGRISRKNVINGHNFYQTDSGGPKRKDCDDGKDEPPSKRVKTEVVVGIALPLRGGSFDSTTPLPDVNLKIIQESRANRLPDLRVNTGATTIAIVSPLSLNTPGVVFTISEPPPPPQPPSGIESRKIVKRKSPSGAAPATPPKPSPKPDDDDAASAC